MKTYHRVPPAWADPPAGRGPARVDEASLLDPVVANKLVGQSRRPRHRQRAGPGHQERHQLLPSRRWAWFTAEHPVLTAAVGQAAGFGWDRHTVHLAGCLWTFFDRRGHWHDLAATQRLALEAAVRADDRSNQAEAHRGLGRALTRHGRHDDAVQHLHQALHLYGELGDPDGQAQTHIALGIVVERQGRHRTALSHTRQALRLYRTAGDRARQAVALNAVGWDHAQLGEHHQALRHCREALELGRRGCPGPVATAWRA
jgi:hypothetical protein